MTSATQVLLVAIITILTIILTIIGIQIVYILKELKETIKKVNKILADAGKVSEKMGNSLSETVGMISGIGTIFKVFNLFTKRGGEKKEKENE